MSKVTSQLWFSVIFKSIIVISYLSKSKINPNQTMVDDKNTNFVLNTLFKLIPVVILRSGDEGHQLSRVKQVQNSATANLRYKLSL